ncbi:hypothetical protein EDM80_08490 [bacterium]|nr:MAG: hypothetical protein EDM80_08490 [bacterium]RIK62260.1 MAG: hypothetical protein DCC64_10960 [Planctomycetota bacterium]
MDRKIVAGVAFIVGALLLGPAAYFFARLDAEGELTSLRREREALLSRAQTAENESASLTRQLVEVKTAGSRTDHSAKEIASEVDRLAREKGEATDRAQQAEADLLKARNEAEDLRRRNEAELDRLKGVLEKHGIYEHLSAEEIQARMADGEERFRRAFEGKDKQGVMKAMADLQKLGPSAYDKCIELWLLAAEDFGTGENWGKGANTLGLNFQEYVSLISNFELVKYGVTDPKVNEAFRINSLYGLPWWTGEPTSQRAKLAGDALLNSSGYTSVAAIEALKDIPDPASVRYLSDYLGKNADNADGRRQAITVLAQKNTPEAWAAIEKAAASDRDERVREAARQAQLTRDPKATGVMITWVDANGQGALAGIRVGDIMVSYNGRATKTLGDVNEAKKTVAEGASAPVKIVRGEETLELTLAPGQIGINGVSVTAK